MNLTFGLAELFSVFVLLLALWRRDFLLLLEASGVKYEVARLEKQFEMVGF